MENLSEILKILDGALKANASMAANYAGLLADKLDASGERNQARQIRERLARAPVALASAQDAGRGVSFSNLPVDGESRLNTVDVTMPQISDLTLVLPSAIRTRVNDFLLSVRHYDALVKAGAAMPSRLFVYGPPGTGKTQLARWVAAELALPLLTVRCDTLISSLLGQTSRNLRRVFEYAQQSPCVLFLDEFDALASARGNDRDVGELQRVVIALLQNMDALPESTILLAASNHENLLDPAVWRRFGFRLPMPMPNTSMRKVLWGKFLGAFAPPDLDWELLTVRSADMSGALIEQVCLDSKRFSVLNGSSVIDPDVLFRRLGLTLALNQGVLLSTDESEIRWLRKWDRKFFTLRTIAKLYDTSLRQITSILKEDEKNGKDEEA